MRATVAIVLAGAFGTFAAAQTQGLEPIATSGSMPITSNMPPQGLGPVPVPAPAPMSGSAASPGGLPFPAPIPVPSGAGPVPVPAPNNPAVAPQIPGQGPQNGVTVQIVPVPSGGGVPVVATGNGPEEVEIVVGPNGEPVIQGPNGLIPVANIIGPNGQPLEPVNEPSPMQSGASASAPGSGGPLNVPATEPIPVTPAMLNNPNAIPEPIPSGASGFPAPGTGVSPTPVMPGQGPGGAPQGGYYNSGAGMVKVTAATFALAVVGIIALWI